MMRMEKIGFARRREKKKKKKKKKKKGGTPRTAPAFSGMNACL